MTAEIQRELLAQALSDEPPFASVTVAHQSIQAGRRGRLRRRFTTGVGAAGLAALVAVLGYSMLPEHGGSSSISVANGVSSRAEAPQAPADQSAAADVTLQRLLEEQGLTLGSRHGFAAAPPGHAAAETRIRGGFNVVGAGSVDVQITLAGPSRCVDPACQTLPDGRSYLIVSEAIPGHPRFGVTTAMVYEGDHRVVSLSMRNYALTPAGQLEPGTAASSYPLEEHQLVSLAAEPAWAETVPSLRSRS